MVVTLRAPAEFGRPYAKFKLNIFVALTEQRQTCMVEKMIDLILRECVKKRNRFHSHNLAHMDYRVDL